MTLSADGFTRARLTELKAQYDELFAAAFGPVNTEADSVLGQCIAIFSAALDDAYETLQNTYDGMYPSSAEGAALDGAVSYVGLTREPSRKTKAYGICYGAQGTIIPSGAFVRALDNKQYTAESNTTITRTNATHVELTINTVSNVADYQIIADGVSYVFTSDASATAQEIAQGLAAFLPTEKFTASAEAGVLTIYSADKYTGFPLSVGSKLTISKLGSPVVFLCSDFGPNVLPANSLTRIDTAVAGWDSINNLVAGITGQNEETDEELRFRKEQFGISTGSATAKAIKYRIGAEVDGVEYVAVYENKTDQTNADNLPPHSFESVVYGGTNQDVGDKVFEVCPAGINFYGNTAIDVIDQNGDAQVVKFSRPVDKYLWVRVSINEAYNEEDLPTEYVQSIKDSVLAHGNTIGIGVDIIVQRFYGEIYSGTNGLGNITVQIAKTDNPLDIPSYTTSNIKIGRAERSVFSLSRISVVG